eukprot:scaffold424528_cov20-Prasinocladus_malaysianus.AAC.1
MGHPAAIQQGTPCAASAARILVMAYITNAKLSTAAVVCRIEDCGNGRRSLWLSRRLAPYNVPVVSYGLLLYWLAQHMAQRQDPTGGQV